jgi:hypothetical protein
MSTTEQQPHLEILSRNKVNRSTIIVAVVPVLAVSVVFIAAIWPHLAEIGLMLELLLLILVCCLAVLLVVGAIWVICAARIELRRRDLQSRVINAGDVVALFDASGSLTVHLSAQHEMAKLLPAPKVEIREEQSVDDVVKELYDHGSSEETIASSLGITRHKVRKVLGKA